MQRTWLSFAPYVFSFAALPWAIFLGAGKSPPLWLYSEFAIFASAFHFLNVIKDLAWDISQGILGLPQRLGRSYSLATAALLIFYGLLLLVFKWSALLSL